ncbi:unnamed protein product, partial [Rotaria sp. Silwood1]
DFSWTPTAAQVGYQVVCAMAFDSQDSQSSQYCFKFYVSVLGVCVCPEHRLLVPQDLLQRVQRHQPLVPHLVQQRQLQAHRLLQQLRMKPL